MFPNNPNDLTAALLTDALRARQPGVEVRSFEVVSTKRCGEGVASTADRMVLRLRYADGRDDGLPDRMVLKTMLASPHAPAEMFETEVRFYNEIRPDLGVETPTPYAAHFDRATGQFGLLMEDLAERGARFPDATQDVSVQQVATLLEQLAYLHARFWQSPRFGADLAWVATTAQGGMSEIFARHGLELIRDQLARHPFKIEAIRPTDANVDELWTAMVAAETQLRESPVTLLHGDPHVGNTYLLPDGRAGLLDWQLQVRGCWAHDVIYLISTALPTAARREHEHALMDGYLEGLRAHGVTPPGHDEAWQWCRRAVLWGLVIGWLITPPENYGVRITRENIRRMVNAVVDLRALDAVRERPSAPQGRKTLTRPLARGRGSAP